MWTKPLGFDSSGAQAHARERGADAVGERPLEGEPPELFEGGE
ncbi:MAG: hypothetical protein OEQ25_06225 [Gammaproteobacteria bacterium]|nr:hypothetical protein [Gammaproteobacteria bacterium]